MEWNGVDGKVKQREREISKILFKDDLYFDKM